MKKTTTLLFRFDLEVVERCFYRFAVRVFDSERMQKENVSICFFNFYFGLLLKS